MAKKKKEEQPAEPEQKQRELPKVPKERNPLLTILTLLLVVVGIGELALWGYFGFSTVQVNRARRPCRRPPARSGPPAERPTPAPTAPG